MSRDCALPNRKSTWDPGNCGHWELWVKYVSRFLALILGVEVGQKWGAEGLHRREERRATHQDLLSLLGIETESEERLCQVR